MKFFRCLVVLFLPLLLMFPVFSENNTKKELTHKDGFVYTFKSSGKEPTEQDCLNYAHAYYNDVYIQYHNDEFEWPERFEKIKGELLNSIASCDVSASYVLYSGIDLGQYNFNSKGFPCTALRKGSSFELLGPEAPNQYDQITYPLNEVVQYIENPEMFNFLPYKEIDARNFTQRRKDRYGNIDRNVFLVIHYTLVPVGSERFFNYFKDSVNILGQRYDLVCTIKEIEVYEDDTLQNKMGDLTKI